MNEEVSKWEITMMTLKGKQCRKVITRALKGFVLDPVILTIFH